MQSFHPSAAPALLAALVLPAVAHAGTMSHVRTVVGQAHGGVGPFGCATSGPQNDIRAWFSAAAGLPTEGYDVCHLKGETINNKGSGATSAASSASETIRGNTGTASALAYAEYTRMGAASASNLTGGPYDLNWHEAEGTAFVTDTLKFLAGANSTATTGFVRFGFTIDGAMHSAANGQAFAELSYQVGNGSVWSMMSAELSGPNGARFRTEYTPGFTNYTQSAFDFSINGTVYSDKIPITFGQAFDFTYALFSAAYSVPDGGFADSAFGSTVKLTAVSVVDAQGRPIDFTIGSGSGTRYDALGAHAPLSGVPEPANWALLILGFGAAGATLRCARRAAPSGAGAAQGVFHPEMGAAHA